MTAPGRETAPRPSSRQAALPRVSAPLVACFHLYSIYYLKRHFHAVRLSQAGLPPPAEGRAMVVFFNHAAWWDALLGLHLARTCYGSRRSYGPIDAKALARYGFFRRLGFFGVEPGTTRGAALFLRTAEAILREPSGMLWLTPQGRFADVRERPVRFMPGLGHLAGRLPEVAFVPLTFEYVFWEERLPEALLRFGPAVIPGTVDSAPPDARGWTGLLERRLEEIQNALATESQRRDPGAFRILLTGRKGVGGIYDIWRAWRARLRGESFQPGHGSL